MVQVLGGRMGKGHTEDMGARGWGRWKGRGRGRQQTTKGSGNKDQLLRLGGGGGHKRKTGGAIGYPGVRGRGARGKPGLSWRWG